ncbi:mastermind-like protein 3 isoform X1 [Sinocyclocheilus grahami]|uniref:mastermind-like protein 3 isoform X1 n=1 Tax=Sinocyclocheilus grahami TaxID=75366 RepID=UPI0007AD1193|nr:PREDICTED: mastermind-like protein 3 isoform X1 [Sinocyclocheilus grahami]
MMGDFASPAAVPTGGGICINNNNVNLNSAINATGSSTGGGGNVGIPKHSTVVERLRQRIEGCRRHHVNCESRYHQAHSEQLELDRRDTLSLYQRSLEQRAKKSGNSKQQSKQQEPDSTASAEQRSSTLIALQETVKRKLDSARSPLNGDQNGLSDGSYSPTTKRLRKEGCTGMDSLGSLPPISPLHPMDIKPTLPSGNNSASSNNGTGNGNVGTNHITGRPEDLGKNGGMPDIKLNGSLELEDSFSLLKDMKQEPLDDGGGIESSETSLSNQNKLFSDINLNDQEWQELIDELANTVPEDDMHDLFNEDFEEKKEVSDFTRATMEQMQLAQDPAPNSVATAPNSAPQPQSGQKPMGSPQVRPSSSGPPFATAANGTPPQQPLQQSPAVGMPSGSPANCVERSPQTPTQAQTQASRPGNGFMMNAGPGVGPGASTPVTGGGPGSGGTGGAVPPTSELSPAEQLKQMAAQQQQRAKLIQQKHQQQSQAANWSPAGAPTSPYSGPFNPDKPNSPMMYTQAFNASNTMGPKTPSMNNYLPQNHMNMLNQQQQQPNNLAAQNNLNKQLSYSNTKPLTHFSGVDHMSQRMTPPMANQAKNPMMPYMQGTGGGPPQAPGPMPNQSAHLSEEQKRMMMIKQKALSQGMPYGSMQQHVQEGVVGLPRQAGGVQPPHGGTGGVTSAGPNGAGPGGYLPNPQQQQQAAMMKQMMAMEQEKRVQLHLMEQQKAQLMREQRQQQQQQHMLAEQLQQQQHLPRQMSQAQRNPYPLQQFQGTPQEMAARNQTLQNMRNARLLQQQQQQNPGILQMTSVQNSGTIPSQGDMSMAYGGQAGTQTGMYQGMNPNMGQMLQQQQQHHPNQPGMAMAQRQAGTGGQGMVAGGGYGQGMLMNPSLQQQQIKSAVVAPGGQPMAKVQRLQSMMGGGGQTWQQQQNMQAMGGRTSNDMVAFNSNPAYAMQGGQAPRMAKQHFAQAIGGQTMVDPRSINPAAMGGPMMQHMAGQPRTNQPRGMVMPGMNQGVPNMAAFGQGPAQGMPGASGGGGPYMPGGQPQGYQRTSSQDLVYSYGSQSGAGAGVSFGLSDGTDLDSTEGWMEEFFPSQ